MRVVYVYNHECSSVPVNSFLVYFTKTKMSGTLCHVLLITATAHLFFTVSGLSVLDPEDDKLGKDIHPTQISLTFSTLPFKNRESLQFVNDGVKLDERNNVDSKKEQVVMTQPKNVKYVDGKDQTLVSPYLNDKDDDGGNNFDDSQNRDTASDALSSNYVYPSADADSRDNGDNLQMLEDRDNILDTEDHNTNFNDMETKNNFFKSHGDEFSCPPCSCSHTAGRSVIANCTKRGIYLFPYHLPKNIKVINLSLNKFRKLIITNIFTYPYLVNVTMESNYQLASISRGYETNNTLNVLYINLYNCGIINIENGSFSIMSSLRNLTLRRNNLTHLTGSMFEGLEKLEYLDVSENFIKEIEIRTFDFFPKLKILDLGVNKHLGYSNKSLLPLLFQNLKRLRKLSLHKVSLGYDKSYPNQALQHLVNLQELGIDGLENPAEFEPGMKSLKLLTHLHIGGGYNRCKIKNITETFFDNLPYLRSFVLERCPNLVRVHPDAYSRLTNLNSLTITLMKYYDIDDAFKSLTAFNNSKLTSVAFNYLREPLYQCKYLGTQQAQYITNLGIEELDLSGNRIALLGNDFLKDLPRTLKRLILKRNKFTAGTQSLNNLAVMKELIDLDLSLQNVEPIYNHDDDFEDNLQPSECSSTYLTESNNDDIFAQKIDDQETKFNRCSEGHANLQSKTILPDDEMINSQEGQRKPEVNNRKINIPPKMRILKARMYNMFGMQILTNRLNKNNSLSVIDFSNSFMSKWGSGMLPQKITQANLADNYCTTINKKFFQANNSHSRLFLNNNFLGPDFASDDRGDIFANLNSTVHLDISTNLIYKLPNRFFKGLLNLKYLKMADNKLTYLNTSLGHMKHLQFIDLKRNAIRWISKNTRNDLDAIASLYGHKVEIDLTMNPLPCTCSGLDLITWMATTKVHFRDKNLLKCDRDSMVSELVVDLEQRRDILQRLCMSKTALITGTVAALSVVMLSVGLGLMYRYRWKLRYLHNIAIAAVFGFQPDVLPESGCTFDAYLVYTKETQDFVINTCIKELELKRGHRLCVEDRDFLAGTYTVSNIVSAVRNSTKTVPVITPTFYNGVFSEYSFKMAVMEELYKNRCVLHLLLYKPVPTEQMSHDELKVMKRNSYIEFPPEEEADDNIRQKFWDDLSLAIGHTDNPMPQELPGMQ